MTPLVKVFAAIAVLGCLAGCGSGRHNGELDASLAGRNLVILTLDTTRADRLGSYGYSAARTPVLDRLAEDGIRFTQAVAQSPMTLPSHTSLFTGNNPSYHGVRENGLYALAEEQTTLAEILRDHGYRTGAVVAAAVLEARYGLAQGFDVYDDRAAETRSAFHVTQRRGDEVTRAALEVMQEIDGEQPFFLWVHYFDPHKEYDPPAEHARKFPNTESGRYDGEIAAMDAAIGDLLRDLERAGHRDDTILVAVADHGEGIDGPHDEWTHGMLLYHDTLAIPMIVAAPRGLRAGREIDDVVRTIDLMPTLLELLELPLDEPVQGRSLASLLRASDEQTEGEDAEDVALRTELELAAYSETFAPYHSYGWSPLFALREKRFKLIVGPESELYDLERDPKESRNVAADYPDRVADLRERIVRLQGDAHPSASSDSNSLSAAQRRRLRALGYVSEAAGTLPSIDELAELASPAERIQLQAPLAKARNHHAAGAPDRALAVLREQVLAVDPGNLEAHSSVAVIAKESGQWETAAAALERLIELRPRVDSYRTRLADVLIAHARALEAQGDEATAASLTERAIGHYNSAIHDGMNDIQPLVNLAHVYLMRRDLASVRQAEALLRRAVAMAPTNGAAHLNLAVILDATQRKEEALRHTDLAMKHAANDSDRAKAERLRTRIAAEVSKR